MTAGFIFNSLVIGLEFVQYRQFPARNLYETLLIAGWAVAGIFLLFRYKFQIKVLGIFAAPFVSFIMIVTTQLPEEPVPPTGIMNSLWLISHVIAIFLGEAAFALACGVGVLYLLQERAIKTKNHGFFFRRLPSLELLDATGYGCLVVGFSLLSLGLVTGFGYAKSVWGSFWSWDPKEIWSGITWLLYAALLHGRLTMGWRGRKAAIMAIIGFVVVLFTFAGVNFILHGHHQKFTR